jgi:hypothetical protein
MAFRTNENQQLSIYDSTASLTARERRMLEKSWAHEFAEKVFPYINEARFAVLYKGNPASKPITPVNVIIGALVIKEMYGFTDEELMEAVTFNAQIQYALRTTSLEEQPINGRTFSRFRARVYKHCEETGEDLIHDEMCALAGVMKGHIGLKSGTRRMDSLMVSSGCRRMTRLNIMFMTVRGMANRLEKDGRGDILCQGYRQYVKGNEHEDISYNLTREDVVAKMDTVLEDAVRLAWQCESEYAGTDEYRRLVRMIEEQSKEGAGGKRAVKSGEEISPESMQSPTDEDATYRKKAGKSNTGYVANIVEECAVPEAGSGETGERKPAPIIVEYDLQKNTYSDKQFAKDMLGAQPDGGGEIDRLHVDGAFVDSETLALAEEKGIEVIATAMTGGNSDGFEARFEIDESTKGITKCPAGHAPTDSKYSEKNERYTAHFDKGTCESCPHCERCPGQFNKNNARITFTESARNRALYAEKQKASGFQEKANVRNGVEGVPSVLRRRYNLDRWGIRGLVRSKVWFGFKIGAMNTVNMIKTLKRQGGPPCPGSFFADLLFPAATAMTNYLCSRLNHIGTLYFCVNIHSKPSGCQALLSV